MAEYVCDMTDDYPDVPYGSDEYSGTVERRERIVRCRDCEHASPCTLADALHDMGDALGVVRGGDAE